MPPRKIKKNAEAIELGIEINDSIYHKTKALESRLQQIAENVIEAQLKRILAGISEKTKKINLMEFLKNNNDIDLWEEFNVPEDNVETEIEKHVHFTESCNNDSTRELITPAGHMIPVPEIIHPKIDNLRYPRVNEEIAFSVNGTPMVLASASKYREIKVENL